MNEVKQFPQRLQHSINFSISRTFGNVNDLRNWIQHPEKDRTNNGFLNVQIAYDTRKEYREQ